MQIGRRGGEEMMKVKIEVVIVILKGERERVSNNVFFFGENTYNHGLTKKKKKKSIEYDDVEPFQCQRRWREGGRG